MSLEVKDQSDIGHIDNVKPGHSVAAAKEASTKYADLSADWLERYTGPEIDITDEESTRIRWKIDRHILPL